MKKQLETKAFLLRYSDYRGIDTIYEHVKLVETTGFCWFGKIGKRPQKIYLDKVFEGGIIKFYLYTKYKLYECICTTYTYEIPHDGIPSYYSEYLFTNETLQPTVFFKLTSILPQDVSVLENYVVNSSGKPITHDLNKSISSFYLLVQKDEWKPVEKTPRIKKASNKKSIKLANSCVYAKEGVCTNKRCVNYLYECERPSSCVKQKPIIQSEDF